MSCRVEGLSLRQINTERLPQPVQGQALRQAGKLAPMRHHSRQRLGGEWVTVAVDQDSLSAPVGRIQDLRQHRCDRHEKPFAAGSSLVLGLNDIARNRVVITSIEPTRALCTNRSVAEDSRRDVRG